MRPALAALALVLVAAIAQTGLADVRLPRLLGDGVVLQRDAVVRVWGWADDGERVAIRLDGRSLGNTVARQQTWQIEVGPFPAGGPHTLEIAGNNDIEIRDLYFGDVWVASGQSNMQLPMVRVRPLYEDDIAAAGNPLIREFTVPRQYDFGQPADDLDGGEWLAATPEIVLDFSAVAYFFARAIHRQYDVPVGIISSNYGGSTAEGWMSEAALRAFPHYLETAKRYRNDAYLANVLHKDADAAAEWHKRVDAADLGMQGRVDWSRPDVDDSGWPRIQVPSFWAGSPLGDINGVVWFRTSFELPAALQGEDAQLELGRIVDADTTWVNGIEVGNTTYQYPPRRYEIAHDVLRAGRNTIAIRVVNVAGKGGFVSDKPYRLTVGSHPIDLEGEWRYQLGAASAAMAAPAFVAHRQPLGFYNAMLAPLQNMTIKGVIWYQGESNVERAKEYATLFPALIRDWRKKWRQGDFPFLFVQLANYLEAADAPGDSDWAELRNAQSAALSEPNTAMAVAIDIGEWNDIHPQNKRDVGERLALAARKVAYGESGLLSAGPAFRSLEAETRNGRLRVHFDNVGGGLSARGDRPGGFDIAGADRVYVRATARIDGDSVVVWSDAVADPMMLRYGWADNPVDANLCNSAGLPASPFRARLAD